jgi:hypothetical protein
MATSKMVTMKVQVTGKILKELGEIAIRNETQDAWIEVALEWITEAEAEIVELRKRLVDWKALDQMRGSHGTDKED